MGLNVPAQGLEVVEQIPLISHNHQDRHRGRGKAHHQKEYGMTYHVQTPKLEVPGCADPEVD